MTKHDEIDDEVEGRVEGEAEADADASPVSEVEELRRECGKLEDQLKRAMADLANIRKRQAKEFDEARKRGVEVLSSELLPVLDNFYLALAAHEQGFDPKVEVKAMVDGLLMVRGLLEATLERHGLAEIPADGETFDPNLHEAVGVDATTDAEAGTITQVVQRGYRLGDKILRASRVLVAGEPEASAADTDEQDQESEES